MCREQGLQLEMVGRVVKICTRLRCTTALEWRCFEVCRWRETWDVTVNLFCGAQKWSGFLLNGSRWRLRMMRCLLSRSCLNHRFCTREKTDLSSRRGWIGLWVVLSELSEVGIRLRWRETRPWRRWWETEVCGCWRWWWIGDRSFSYADDYWQRMEESGLLRMVVGKVRWGWDLGFWSCRPVSELCSGWNFVEMMMEPGDRAGLWVLSIILLTWRLLWRDLWEVETVVVVFVKGFLYFSSVCCREEWEGRRGGEFC